MALTCGFFNSVDGDRKYDATQFASLFDGVITDGVVAAVGDFFATTPGGGMTVDVGTGRAWFNRTWTYSDAKIPLTLDGSDLLYDRIDAVILEIDTSVAVRDNSIKVIKGTPAQEPQKPALTNEGDIHQYALAYVRVKASSIEIGAGDITINVGQADCPFVTSIVDTPELDVLFAQWDAQFTSWFENVQSQLEGDVAANLQRQIDLKANKTDIGDFTTPAKKLGLIEKINVGASLSVLADIGDLNVWRRTVEISEGEPASYTLGSKTDRIIFSGGYYLNGRGRADYGTTIKVYDNGDIALSGTTGYVAESLVVLSDFNVIKGKYVRFSEYRSESALSPECENKIFYIPSSASFTYTDGSTDRTIENYGMRITDTQLVTGVPAVSPGTYIDYPVSVDPNAYQEGDDGQPAGYMIKYLGALGEKCTAKTGTYIGTGSYGESAANYIPFDRLPSLFIVAGIPENIYNSQMIIPTFLLSDTVDDTLCGMSVYSRSTTPSWRRIKSVYKHGRLYWYSEDDRYGQMNYANTKYTWIALFL